MLSGSKSRANAIWGICPVFFLKLWLVLCCLWGSFKQNNILLIIFSASYLKPTSRMRNQLLYIPSAGYVLRRPYWFYLQFWHHILLYMSTTVLETSNQAVYNGRAVSHTVIFIRLLSCVTNLFQSGHGQVTCLISFSAPEQKHWTQRSILKHICGASHKKKKKTSKKLVSFCTRLADVQLQPIVRLWDISIFFIYGQWFYCNMSMHWMLGLFLWLFIFCCIF